MCKWVYLPVSLSVAFSYQAHERFKLPPAPHTHISPPSPLITKKKEITHRRGL